MLKKFIRKSLNDVEKGLLNIEKGFDNLLRNKKSYKYTDLTSAWTNFNKALNEFYTKERTTTESN